MCPERRRRTVESVRRTLGQEKVSERRVCRVLGQNRGTQRHRPRKVDGDRELLGVMRKIVETFPRHGSERTHRVLTGPEAFGGWKVNIKRVHRIWKEEHMQVPQKQRKRRRLPCGIGLCIGIMCGATTSSRSGRRTAGNCGSWW
jgi:hypothetical protein